MIRYAIRMDTGEMVVGSAHRIDAVMGRTDAFLVILDRDGKSVEDVIPMSRTSYIRMMEEKDG